MKSIDQLIRSTLHSENGMLKGGFFSIKGGISLVVSTNVQSCTNQYSCTGSNQGVVGNECKNQTYCSGSNPNPQGCINSGVCS